MFCCIKLWKADVVLIFSEIHGNWVLWLLQFCTHVNVTGLVIISDPIAKKTGNSGNCWSIWKVGAYLFYWLKQFLIIFVCLIIKIEFISLYLLLDLVILLWKFLQPIVFKILAHFWHGLMYYKSRHKSMHGPLGCWICLQFPLHTEDCESLLFLWLYPLINKPLLYSILGYFGMPLYCKIFSFGIGTWAMVISSGPGISTLFFMYSKS